LKVTRKSPYAIYFFGLTFLLYGIIFSLYRLSDILICTGLAILAYTIAGKVLPQEEIVVHEDIAKTKGNAALNEAIEEANGYLKAIRQKNTLIADEEITQKLDRIEAVTKEIFDVALVKDEEVKDVRRMLNYYLPTVIKLLDTYVELSSKSYSGENITGSMNKIAEMLSTIITAFEKHLDEMYSQEAMDIDSEIMVLEQILISEGLLEKKDQTITLK